MPFPRLVDAVDQWSRKNPTIDVFGQINDQDPDPLTFETVPLMPPDELRHRIMSADVVVAHAGMGTIISCLELGVPLILLPRHADLRETRNDHQRATADHFGDRPGIWAASATEDVADLLDRHTELRDEMPVATPPDPGLIRSLKAFIDG